LLRNFEIAPLFLQFRALYGNKHGSFRLFDLKSCYFAANARQRCADVVVPLQAPITQQLHKRALFKAVVSFATAPKAGVFFSAQGTEVL